MYFSLLLKDHGVDGICRASSDQYSLIARTYYGSIGNFSRMDEEEFHELASFASGAITKLSLDPYGYRNYPEAGRSKLNIERRVKEKGHK